ncbi:hypothetical protein PMSD_21180 [Paenibacillus macquariensis subsp. defensor]|nr:hypothetical protein PMSD_21180 [Paenibacillus macquariensis subsp. defensor]
MINTEYSLSLGLAAVTPSGLKFEDLFYSNAKMIKYGWFEIAKKGEEWQIPILYDSNDLSSILLIDIDSITCAIPIEDVSKKVDPEMIEFYFSAIESLKNRLRNNRGKV